MRTLWMFMKLRKWKWFFTMLLLIGQVTGTLLVPFLIAGLVDNGIMAGDKQAVITIGIQMLLVSLLTTAVSVAGSYLSADLAADFGRLLRQQLFEKSQKLSVTTFEAAGVPSMITRATSDIAVIQQTLGMALQLVVPAPFIVLTALVMTLQVNVALAGILTGCVVLFLLFTVIVFQKSQPLSSQIQTRLDRINQVVREAISGVRVIRAFGNEQYEERRASGAFEGYASNLIRLNKLFAVLNPVVWMIMGLSVAGVLWAGGIFSAKHIMNVGEITAVIEYTVLTLSYLIMAASSSVMLPKMGACLSRIAQVLAMPQGKQCASKADLTITDAPVIAFEDVSFSFDGAEAPAVEHISFTCRAGETVAMIGGTGAGKSTLADLMVRLYEPDHGSIKLYGTDIRELSEQALWQTVGYVPQKAFLFSGTVAENLRMGSGTATAQDMEHALQVAQAGFIYQMPSGLNTPVAQGGKNFSGGQKQRLAIARALVKQAPLYIFDDSFSALDLKTDAALRRALKEVHRNAAKIIIAQRVSSILDADQILVLHEGRLVGKGSHQSLLQSCPAYCEIVKSQLQLQGD